MPFRDLSCRSIALLIILNTSPFTLHTSAQRPPEQPDAAKILHKMQKLNVLGSVLYIVAHPDDENTRLIAWLANGKKVRTADLSLTRGDGGQNLIGPELGDALGIIRTQELLEARRIDGGEQFFTRAVDFGYSKSAKESFEKWGHDEVLSDVVRVIRTFRPDIIITRFPPTREAGHGHHEASAILAEEAFKLAGDPKAFPEQLAQGVEVWQPRRLFFNGSTWWKKNLAEIAKPDSGWYTVDVGGYDPLLGLSYTEIAGRSRSMHKSQGFGAAETRGEMIEYLKLIAGDKPKTSDIFEGIDMTWGKVSTSTSIQRHVRELIDTYSPAMPAASDSLLCLLNNELNNHDKNIDEQGWLSVKTRQVEDLLMACNGLVVEALCDADVAITGSLYTFKLTATNRGKNALAWILSDGTEKELGTNMPVIQEITQQATMETDIPFWLRLPHNTLYTIGDPTLIGQPDILGQLVTTVRIRFDKRTVLRRVIPVQHRWVDRVKGELTQTCAVVPPASVHAGKTIILMTADSVDVPLGVDVFSDSLKGGIVCSRPENCILEPMYQSFAGVRGDRIGASVRVKADKGSKCSDVDVSIGTKNGMIERTQRTITYDHITTQRYSTPSFFRVIPVSVSANAKLVGYIKGAGDDVAQGIEQLGVKVDLVDPATASLESLTKYDAIVTGIRAYNTVEAMKTLNPLLMKYVEQGGTLVCQYNTKSSDMMLPDSLFGPYPFKLTRDRVTVEEAPPTFLAKDHPLLNTPNKITTADFDGWVQERGLYFCGSLDPHYTPLIAWNDPGEQPLTGGLITCDYGKGRYIYTGISFFRELPAGVPGAYRLFANLISKRQ